MTRPEDLEGDRLLDRDLGEVVRVDRVEADVTRLGEGAVELRRSDGSTYFVRYLELGFNLDDRFARPTAADGSGDTEE